MTEREMGEKLMELCQNDINGLLKAKVNYGDSWKKRGGTGAFMMLARKWDRLELACSKKEWDIHRTINDDQRAEGVLDDIRDLRRYLLLVEQEWGMEVAEVAK